ncbi:hypothetical protein llap_6330 [Limosa lapponica baueri]|uniref:Uncharacterized protein n=1 Tax=Limosa lapponica baueri TaxID=1758121 RepID=A0A2I0UBD4_LIMLA|nr:hypothetical protein llap_6330 [Limosa lapponica baueri]
MLFRSFYYGEEPIRIIEEGCDTAVLILLLVWQIPVYGVFRKYFGPKIVGFYLCSEDYHNKYDLNND